jgi:predicted DNA repair protein MutK
MTTITRWLVILAIAAFAISILASMLFETLLPLARQGDWLRFGLNVVGMPTLLAGTGALIWGAMLLVRGNAVMMEDEKFSRNRVIIEERESSASVRAAQRAQYGHMARAWRPSVLWLAAGTVLLIIGSYLVNW